MAGSALPWDRAGWRESVAAWIDEALTDLGLERVGSVHYFRQRLWAALARVATTAGDVYFKAGAPSEAFEPALTQWLAQRRQDLMPEVLRIDAQRGWLLTRDSGTSLLDRIGDPPDPAIWHELLPLCAELQIELASSALDLLALSAGSSTPSAAWSAAGDSSRERTICCACETPIEPWTTFAPLDRLIELSELAYPLGMICRALSWDRLGLLAQSGREDYTGFVPAWLAIASETVRGKARLGE